MLNHCLKALVAVISAVSIGVVLAASDTAAHGPEKKPAPAVTAPAGKLGRLEIPPMDPVAGKRLFVAKGCVACHAINGVGGHDAPAMDAHTMDKRMNPFDFAAKMWNHAAGMIAAQESAFGEQITLTGDELAHIVLFVHHDEAQHHFTEGDLTPRRAR